MTKKDFERIARVLGYCEQHCDDEEMELVRWVAEKFSDDLASDHPRFKRGVFMTAALPIRNAEVKRAIVAKLKSGKPQDVLEATVDRIISEGGETITEISTDA